MNYSLRQQLGAIVYDLPRFAWAMRPVWTDDASAAPWIFFCNRNERLILGQDRQGAACDWQWSSDLHVAKVFPALGLRLLRRALRERPVRLQPEPRKQPTRAEVSFIIGHRGLARLPHLLITLQSIAAQRDVACQCIVVEQSERPEIQAALPAWVRYIHTPLPHPDMPYCRSWAFNVGARLAESDLLIFHDNDMLVPQDYALEILAKYRSGYEVINLKRYVFYLTRPHSERIFSSRQMRPEEAPETIVQNLEAGGSLAVSKKACFALGGFDESFVGWGGEDNEFWERAQTRSVWPYAYMPIVHLWHEAQPEKNQAVQQTASLFAARAAIPVVERIVELASRNFGDLKQPVPSYCVEQYRER